MNINLDTMIARHTLNTMPHGDADTLEEEIREHVEIMRNGGFDITGPPVLIPEGIDYPGSYQVWSPCMMEDDADGQTVTTPAFVYVNPEGRAIFIEKLPDAEDFSS